MTGNVAAPTRSLIVVSDFVCPWCYVGLQQASRLAAEQTIEMRFAPYLLDPDTPPQGKSARHRPDEHGKPAYLEQRGLAAGLTFTKGRTWQPSTVLAHEAAEFVAEHHAGLAMAFHQAVFRAHFTDLADISSADVLLTAAESAGVPAAGLRKALETHAYRQHVEDGVAWARDAGIRSVPTFIFDEQWAIVGAQEWRYFEEALRLAEAEAPAPPEEGP